jgi:hypothetical protein
VEEKISVHDKPRGEKVYAYISEFKGTKYLHIREWYMDNNEEKPTKKGVTLPMDKIEALRDAINQLLAQEKPAAE